MRRPAVLLLGLLAACGSGAGTGAEDPVTHVLLVEDLGPDPAGGDLLGYSSWSEEGSSIKLRERTSSATRLAILEHELWHQLTRIENHPNPSGCVSTLDGLSGFYPCPEEIAQVNDAARVVELSFPADPDCARDAAAWWNEALGREAVVVVD